jgi:RNA polymerase sigma factor (sigma-70 family)
MAESRTEFVERLFARHRDALQAFFYRRIRTKSDAADLAQEVYLRMLRVTDTDDIRSPAAYLYAVAGNLLKENAAKDLHQRGGLEIDEDDEAQRLGASPGSDDAFDAGRRVERLRVVLKQLPPKCCAAVVLRYRYELSVPEIAERLEVSTHMVKKYLGQALGHCRRRMARLG